MKSINEKNKALKAVPRRKPAARKVVSVVRRSDRIQNNPAPVNMDEDSMFKSLGFAVPRAPATRGSNLGVRRQGGRIYDSENGVTCHWCRQKTLEDHVVCTSEDCSGGSKLPVSFCRMCLWNRHGENVYDAIASGTWVCPRCRGGCGDGCKCCCNCGPCRKKNGLAPTHQIVKEARVSGFDNVHDYLIHLKTSEPPSKIAKRKFEFDWGKWLLGEDSYADDIELEEENQEENRRSVRRTRARNAVGGADSSPSLSQKFSRAAATKHASPAKTAGASKVETVDTPAKTTPIATRRARRGTAARGLAMAAL